MDIRSTSSGSDREGLDIVEVQPQQKRALQKSSAVLNIVCVLSVLFGLALIANVQTTNEGTWYWYAYFLQHGKHLYGDMHLALQPLFVLETSWFLTIAGKTWLASKIPAVFHEVLYSIGLVLVLRLTRLSDWQRAIIFACVFTVSCCALLVRFDDYHVLGECFLLYSALLLLILQDLRETRLILMVALGLGVLSGLAIENRINDGAALFVGVGIALLCMAPAKRMVAVSIFVVAGVVTALLVVRLTGDSLHDYAVNSIFHAAAGKGGTASILIYPLEVPGNAYLWMRKFGRLPIIAITFAIALIWTWMIRPVMKKLSSVTLGLACIGVLLTARMMQHRYHEILEGSAVPAVSTVGMYLLYGSGFLLLYRILRWLVAPGHLYRWDRREALYLLPFGYLVSMSTSSAGSHLGTFSWFGFFILVVAIMQPEQHWPEWLSQTFFALAVLLTIYATCYKSLVPYGWHSYQSRTLFQGREWYRHPVYGPMIIEKREVDFIEPVCRDIRAGGGRQELLSLPYPYANYYCDIPPWHDYVQTFFDTSAPATIYGLVDELQNNPPDWILYQRQVYTLHLHEEVYNRGQAIPHRYLDELIEQKLSKGAWHVVYASNYDQIFPRDNNWLLIRTR